MIRVEGMKKRQGYIQREVVKKMHEYQCQETPEGEEEGGKKESLRALSKNTGETREETSCEKQV